jgi:hypothetical protein
MHCAPLAPHRIPIPPLLTDQSHWPAQSDVIAQYLHGNDAGLFVDDTTREHLDPALQTQCPGLHRVLFCSTNYSLTTQP